MNKKSIKIWILIVFIILSLGATVSLLQGCKNALKSSSVDFGMRYITTKLILGGENPYQMLLKKTPSEYLKRLREGNKFKYYDPYYFPSSLLPIIPYSFMSYDKAIVAWLITNIIATAMLLISVFFLINKNHTGITHRNYLLCVLLFLCGTPFRVTIGLGQFSIIVLAFFILALFAVEKNRWFLGGVLLSFSLLKYPLTLPFIFVFFILKKRWAPLIVCGIFQCITYLWMCFLIKVSPVKFFSEIFAVSLKVFQHKEGIIGSSDIWLLTVRLKKIINYNVFCDYFALIVFLGIVCFIGFLWIKRRKSISRIGWLSIISVFTFFSVYHRVYDGIIFLFPLLWIIALKENNILRFFIAMGVSYYFFSQRILFEITKYTHFSMEQLTWASFFFFFPMLYSVLRLAYLESQSKKSALSNSYKY
jgi:hypothetical protein